MNEFEERIVTASVAKRNQIWVKLKECVLLRNEPGRRLPKIRSCKTKEKCAVVCTQRPEQWGPSLHLEQCVSSNSHVSKIHFVRQFCENAEIVKLHQKPLAPETFTPGLFDTRTLLHEKPFTQTFTPEAFFCSTFCVKDFVHRLSLKIAGVTDPTMVRFESQ